MKPNRLIDVINEGITRFNQLYRDNYNLQVSIHYYPKTYYRSPAVGIQYWISRDARYQEEETPVYGSRYHKIEKVTKTELRGLLSWARRGRAEKRETNTLFKGSVDLTDVNDFEL